MRLAVRVPVPNECGLAEQGVHAARTHPVGPEISRIGTSHERRGGSWEVQGPKYYNFVVCKPLVFHYNPLEQAGPDTLSSCDLLGSGPPRPRPPLG